MIFSKLRNEHIGICDFRDLAEKREKTPERGKNKTDVKQDSTITNVKVNEVSHLHAIFASLFQSHSPLCS